MLIQRLQYPRGYHVFMPRYRQVGLVAHCTGAGSCADRVLYSCAAGVIQVTEYDEFSYQEMITHLPLCAI